MRKATRAVLGLAICAGVHVAWAQPEVQRYPIKIDRLPLKAALVQLSQRTGRHISFLIESAEHRDVLVGPLEGQYSMEAALKELSSDAGVVFVRVNDHTILVTPKSPSRVKRSGLTTEAAPAPRGASTNTRARRRAPSSPNGERKSQHNLEEVVVTAQKREERLQDVPISISVLDGNDLDGLTSAGVTEALSRAPGVTATAPIQGGAVHLAIRGVSAGGAFFNGSSPIAYYLDSVPFGLVKTAVIPDASVYDLERIEVLRGPQGTLYGASAQNGVVRVLSKEADLNALEVKTRAMLSVTEHGSENYRGDMAINIPVIESKLAARAVVGYESMSGWIDKPNNKGANDAQLRNMRLKLNGQFTDQLSLGLSAWLSRSDHGAASIGDANRRRTSTLDESVGTGYDLYGLKIGYQAESFSITGNTGYLDYRYDGSVDLQPFITIPAVLSSDLKSDVLSQEILVNSLQEGAWRWSLGGIYRDAEDRLIQTSPFLALPIDFTDGSESFAIFGQITRVLLDGRFEITAGLRYFEDDVTQIENVPQSDDPTAALIPPNRRTFDAMSPRLVFTWHPVDDMTLYASYAEGFRSGFNQNANIIRVAPDYPAVKADTLKNYEIGAKGASANGLFSYEAAIYYFDWQDVQQTLTVDIGGVPASVLVNGESASGPGAEFALGYRLLNGLQFAVNFSWNDLQVDSNAVTAGVPLYSKGDRLNFSSEYTAGASADYAFALGSAYQARISASADYLSSLSYRNVLGSGVVVDVSEEQTIVGTRASIDSPNGWTVTAFIDNLTNENRPGVGLFGVPEWTTRPRPRTAGVQVEYRF